MNIVIIAGSNRKASTSTRLAEYAGRVIRQQGHQVTVFDFHLSPLPFFSPDESYPEHAALRELKKAMLEADAVILSTPEYHGSMSGVLKNALDHLGQDHFSGKVVLSMNSAGGTVGVSSLQHIQTIVRNLHGINCPDWMSIGGSQRRWIENDRDDYEGHQEIDDRIHRVLASFLNLARLVRGHAINSVVAI